MPIAINGSGSITGIVDVNVSGATTSGTINVSTDASTIRLTDTDTELSNGELSSQIEFYSSDSDAAGVKASIKAIGNGSLGNCDLAISTGINTERLRIDSTGRLLVGTSSALAVGVAPGFQLASLATSNGAHFNISRFNNDTGAGALSFGKSRSGTVGTVGTVGSKLLNNDTLGAISFYGDDGEDLNLGAISFYGDDGIDLNTIAASIQAFVDGTPGENVMPGRIVFSTNGDVGSGLTERMRITSDGYLKASNNGVYMGSTSSFHELRSTENTVGTAIRTVNASFTSTVLQLGATRAASTAYSFLQAFSAIEGSSDTEYNLRGDGTGFCDGTWTSGGADYAEYFEWSDSNLDEEDRRGISVVLDGNKIREALPGEDPIGVISGNPSVVGDAAWNRWSGKYLRDEYGTYIQEDYEVEDEDDNTVIQQRRKLNPAYDPDLEYVSRENRPEWDCVGLMGKLRIRKGQATGSRWIKMRDINDSVEEWLVR